MIKRGPSIPDSIARLRAGLADSESRWQTIFDIGGGTGTGFLIRAFPGAHHIIYEPNEEFFAEIHQLYQGESYDVIKTACGDYTGSMTVKTMDSGRLKQVTVECVDILTEIQSCDKPGPYVVKIDTDGDDDKILSRLTNVAKDIEIVIIETRLDQIKNISRHLWFEENGYELYDIANLMYVDGQLLQTDNVYVQRKVLKQMTPTDKYEKEVHVRYVN
jgi:FkbM family methyltransferase